MHCVDILDALTKNFLGTAEEGGDLPPSKGPERHNYNPVTTTLKRQREIVCAKTVQKAWREYVGRRRGLSPEAARAAAIEATAAAHQHHADIAAEAQAATEDTADESQNSGKEHVASPRNSEQVHGTEVKKTVLKLEELLPAKPQFYDMTEADEVMEWTVPPEEQTQAGAGTSSGSRPSSDQQPPADPWKVWNPWDAAEEEELKRIQQGNEVQEC